MNISEELRKTPHMLCLNFFSYVKILKNPEIEIRQKALEYLYKLGRSWSVESRHQKLKVAFQQLALLSERSLKYNDGYDILIQFLERASTSALVYDLSTAKFIFDFHDKNECTIGSDSNSDIKIENQAKAELFYKKEKKVFQIREISTHKDNFAIFIDKKKQLGSYQIFRLDNIQFSIETSNSDVIVLAFDNYRDIVTNSIYNYPDNSRRRPLTSSKFKIEKEERKWYISPINGNLFILVHDINTLNGKQSSQTSTVNCVFGIENHYFQVVKMEFLSF